MPKFTSMEGGFAGPTSLVTQYPFNICAGGTITEVGKYRLHTFTTSGAFTVQRFGGISPLIEVFVLGGGGGGAPAYQASTVRSGYAPNSEYMAGGGGSGGAIYHPGFTFPVTGNYVVVVGAGATNTPGSNASYGALGNDSTLTVGSTVFRGKGGGAGGFYGSSTYNGVSGGSGGGTGTTGGIILNRPSPASLYATQGNYPVAGATTYGNQGGGTQQGGGGGGGGLGGIGLEGIYKSNNSPHGTGGGGGPGIANPCVGSTYTPIGGGGGGGGAYNDFTEATAGSEYLGRLDAAANYGGGGGGGSIFQNDGGWGGAGGSGIVILRYRIAV